MILFLKDWEKYSAAVVHMETRNKSFIKISHILKDLGTKNYKFPLALLNPDLRNVDPFDPNITTKQIQMVTAEITDNVWYFFREILMVPGKGGGPDIHLRANRGNIAIIWLYFIQVTVLAIQLRQTGKTLTVSGLIRGLLNFWAKNSSVNYFTKDNALRYETVEKIKDLEKSLPDYLQFTLNKDNGNRESIRVKSRNSVLKTSVGQSSVGAARKIARGHSIPNNIIDEGPFISHVDITVPAMLASAVGVIKNMKESGIERYGTLFITTSAVRDTASAKYMYKMYQQSFLFTEALYDLPDKEAVHKLVRQNSLQKDTVLVDFSYSQLGITKQELKDMLIFVKATLSSAKTDFFSMWPSGTDASPFNRKQLKGLEVGKNEDFITSISEEGYLLRWHVDPEKAKNVYSILGSDTSEAIGRDSVTLTMSNAITGETMAVGEYNNTNTLVLSKFIASILIDYPKALLIMERKSTGSSIIDNIITILIANKINPFKRLFNWTVEDKFVNKDNYRELMNTPIEELVHSKFRKTIGFSTTKFGRTAREKIYGESIIDCVSYLGSTARDSRLIKQIEGLVIKNGRIDHVSGEHDDIVFSWGLNYWFLTQVRNVEDYGLNKKLFLSKMKVDDSKSMYVKEQESKQQKIKEHLIKLLEELETSKKGVKSELLKRKIRSVHSRLSHTNMKQTSIDDVILGIEIEKEKSNIRKPLDIHMLKY